MKLLTILLLAIVTCFGQGKYVKEGDSTVIKYPSFGEHQNVPLELAIFTIPLGNRVIYNRGTMEVNMPINELVLLYQEYKAECYADSTTKRVHESPLINGRPEPCLMDWHCLIGSHYKEKTFHREPTFEEFMEWLERKYK